MVGLPNIMTRDQFPQKPTTFKLEIGSFYAKNLLYHYPNSAAKYFKLFLRKFVLKTHSRNIFKSQEQNYRSNSIVCENHTQLAQAARHSISIKICFKMTWSKASKGEHLDLCSAQLQSSRYQIKWRKQCDTKYRIVKVGKDL